MIQRRLNLALGAMGLGVLIAIAPSCAPDPGEDSGSRPLAGGKQERRPGTGSTPSLRESLVVDRVAVATQAVQGSAAPSDARGAGPEIEGFEALGKNARGLVEYRHLRSGLTMVLLNAGSFQMGTAEDAPGYRVENESPLHHVALDAFLIAKNEVTQATWTRIMGRNPSKYRGPSLPVQNVSWNLARLFCERTGLKLPTEAQWEYACRAGTQTAYAGRGRADEMGWYRHNSEGQPHPPGRKRANDFGLHDMHGNVMEWCEDVYDPEFYGKPAASEKNPLARSGSEFRICRGGDFLNDVRTARSAHRGGDRPVRGFPNIGLRPAFYPIPAPEPAR